MKQEEAKRCLYASCISFSTPVISNQKIQLYVYDNISYKTVPIRNFRLVGNNDNFVKWMWNHFVIGCERLAAMFMLTKILPRMHIGLEEQHSLFQN